MERLRVGSDCGSRRPGQGMYDSMKENRTSDELDEDVETNRSHLRASTLSSLCVFSVTVCLEGQYDERTRTGVVAASRAFISSCCTYVTSPSA
jgi:hypothetical protein